MFLQAIFHGDKADVAVEDYGTHLQVVFRECGTFSRMAEFALSRPFDRAQLRERLAETHRYLNHL